MVQDVTAGIFRRENRVLIARRSEGRHAGEWEFPGGKVEIGEAPEHCLRRELHEEFSVDVVVGEFLMESIYDYGFGTIRLLAYEVNVESGELKPVDHDKIEWVEPYSLLDFNLLPADIPIAEFLQNHA